MEIWQVWDATQSARGIDVVIEDLNEFAVGRATICQLTNADYVTQVMAPVAVG